MVLIFFFERVVVGRVLRNSVVGIVIVLIEVGIRFLGLVGGFCFYFRVL